MNSMWLGLLLITGIGSSLSMLGLLVHKDISRLSTAYTGLLMTVTLGALTIVTIA